MKGMDANSLYDKGLFSSFLPNSQDLGDKVAATSWLDMREHIQLRNGGIGYIIPRVSVKHLESPSKVHLLYKYGFIPVSLEERIFFSLAWETLAQGGTAVKAYSKVFTHKKLMQYLQEHVSTLLFSDGTYIYPKDQSDRYKRYSKMLKSDGLYFVYKKTSTDVLELSDAYVMRDRNLIPVWMPLKSLMPDQVFTGEDVFVQAEQKHNNRIAKDIDRRGHSDLGEFNGLLIKDFRFIDKQLRAIVQVDIDVSCELDDLLHQTMPWRERTLNIDPSMRKYMSKVARVLDSYTAMSPSEWRKQLNSLKESRVSYWEDDLAEAKAEVDRITSLPEVRKAIRIENEARRRINERFANTKIVKNLNRYKRQLLAKSIDVGEVFDINLTEQVIVLEEAKKYLIESVNTTIEDDFDSIFPDKSHKYKGIESYEELYAAVERDLIEKSQQMERRKLITKFRNMQIRANDTYARLEGHTGLAQLVAKCTLVKKEAGLVEAIARKDELERKAASTLDMQYAALTAERNQLRRLLKQDAANRELSGKLSDTLRSLKKLSRKMKFEASTSKNDAVSKALRKHFSLKLSQVVQIRSINRILRVYQDVAKYYSKDREASIRKMLQKGETK